MNKLVLVVMVVAPLWRPRPTALNVLSTAAAVELAWALCELMGMIDSPLVTSIRIWIAKMKIDGFGDLVFSGSCFVSSVVELALGLLLVL